MFAEKELKNIKTNAKMLYKRFKGNNDTCVLNIHWYEVINQLVNDNIKLQKQQLKLIEKHKEGKK